LRLFTGQHLTDVLTLQFAQNNWQKNLTENEKAAANEYDFVIGPVCEVSFSVWLLNAVLIALRILPPTLGSRNLWMMEGPASFKWRHVPWLQHYG
jgi:hypothetical protein